MPLSRALTRRLQTVVTAINRRSSERSEGVQIVAFVGLLVVALFASPILALAFVFTMTVDSIDRLDRRGRVPMLARFGTGAVAVVVVIAIVMAVSGSGSPTAVG